MRQCRSLPTVSAAIRAPLALIPHSFAESAVGYLPQEVERRPGETVLDHLGRRTGVSQAQRALDGAAHALTGGTAAAADDAYAAALDRWLSLGAADLAERTGAVLDDLGLAVDRRRR